MFDKLRSTDKSLDKFRNLNFTYGKMKIAFHHLGYVGMSMDVFLCGTGAV